jgi:hypothetical protein
MGGLLILLRHSSTDFSDRLRASACFPVFSRETLPIPDCAAREQSRKCKVYHGGKSRICKAGAVPDSQKIEWVESLWGKGLAVSVMGSAARVACGAWRGGVNNSAGTKENDKRPGAAARRRGGFFL